VTSLHIVFSLCCVWRCRH